MGGKAMSAPPPAYSIRKPYRGPPWHRWYAWYPVRVLCGPGGMKRWAWRREVMFRANNHIPWLNPSYVYKEPFLVALNGDPVQVGEE